jgi:streptomycin 6-kinase
VDAAPAEARFAQHAAEWDVDVHEKRETPSSLLGFGTQAGRPVVLKVVRPAADEWLCGEVIRAFGGHGMVHVYQHAPGAALMERLMPGTPLASLALAGRDDEATEIMAGVVRQMSPGPVATGAVPTVRDWGEGFDRYLASGDTQISRALVEQARAEHAELAAAQRGVRLLHGDLQHYNVLFDERRGWTAIDPKGVIGEPEYELGAMLRNPTEAPHVFASRPAVERRIANLSAALNLDALRIARWAFAQAVLSAVWSVEDGERVDGTNAALQLADAIRPVVFTYARSRR